MHLVKNSSKTPYQGGAHKISSQSVAASVLKHCRRSTGGRLMRSKDSLLIFPHGFNPAVTVRSFHYQPWSPATPWFQEEALFTLAVPA